MYRYRVSQMGVPRENDFQIDGKMHEFGQYNKSCSPRSRMGRVWLFVLSSKWKV